MSNRSHPARTGFAFQIGGTNIYAGPRENGRGTPILAVSRGTEDPLVVAEFRNSTTAEAFIEALRVGIDEATKPATPAGSESAVVDN